ncbi:MAG: hypothetical protein KGL39_04485 [Patescibacteria group bacterium]|nr:hypothetical protein [Patescibacteria group bacterium]
MSRIGVGTLKIAHDTDPKESIRDDVGDIADYKLHGPRILVGIYEPTNEKGEVKTAGGIIVPNIDGGTKDEYKWQGRVGLVLKKGAMAFKDDAENQFHGDDVQVGDWVVFNVNDGRSISIGKHLCKIINDHHVQMTIPHPDAVY